jgi:4-amino-4-deoxy-L-arabinose transferase-like glycosyltransferase
MGADSILYELYAQNVGRFFSGSRGHEQAIYYYITHIWSDLFPWSVLIPFAAVWLVRGPLRERRDVQLLLWWIGVFFVFLSVATTKRQLYLLPVYPAVALVLAPWIDRVTRGRRVGSDTPSPRPALIWSIVAAGILAVLGLALLGLTIGHGAVLERIELTPLEREVAQALRVPIGGLALVMILGAGWIAAAWRRSDTCGALVRLGLAQLPVYLLLIAWLLPAMNPVRSYRPACRWISSRIGDEPRLGLVNRSASKSVHKMGAFGFYTDTLIDILRTPEDVEHFFASHPDSLVMIEDDATELIFRDAGESWRGRVLREMQITGDRYLALAGPDGSAHRTP